MDLDFIFISPFFFFLFWEGRASSPRPVKRWTPEMPENGKGTISRVEQGPHCASN
jgi:hypothetical protein